jgi:hypothetical protein
VEFTKNIQIKAGNYFLSKKLKHFTRAREMQTLKTAQTAGIIVTPSNQDSFDQIKTFLNYLTGLGVKVFVLGYVDDKKVPDTYLFWKGITLFSKNDLNWACIPVSPVVNDFIEQSFDMLIDLSVHDYFPVRYISNLSKSRFKIGRFADADKCYDLMFELNDNPSLDYYIEHLTYYLNLLSNPN